MAGGARASQEQILWPVPGPGPSRGSTQGRTDPQRRWWAQEGSYGGVFPACPSPHQPLALEYRAQGWGFLAGLIHFITICKLEAMRGIWAPLAYESWRRGISQRVCLQSMNFHPTGRPLSRLKSRD